MKPIAENLSLERALTYLDDGARAWANNRGCVSCHTTGWYGILRPQLAESLGRPDADFRAFLEERLQDRLATDPEELQQDVNPAEVVHLAASLASWDAHMDGRLSPETGQALQLMFSLQRDDGAWHSPDTWPPFESDAYQLATVAAMGVGLAPGWLEQAHLSRVGEKDGESAGVPAAGPLLPMTMRAWRCSGRTGISPA